MDASQLKSAPSIRPLAEQQQFKRFIKRARKRRKLVVEKVRSTIFVDYEVAVCPMHLTQWKEPSVQNPFEFEEVGNQVAGRARVDFNVARGTVNAWPAVPQMKPCKF